MNEWMNGPRESSPGSHPATPPLLIVFPSCGFTSASCPSSEPAPGLLFLPHMGNPAADTVLVAPLGQGPGSGSGGGVVPHSVGCRRQGYCTGSFILHSLKRLWSPEHMPYTQEMAWQGRTKSLPLRFTHQSGQLRTQQHPVTSGVRPGELGPLQVCSVSAATQEGCGKFVQVKAWTAGRAARLSPSPRMKCGRRMEGSGPRGPGSTAGDPNRWGVRRSGFGSQAALTH